MKQKISKNIYRVLFIGLFITVCLSSCEEDKNTLSEDDKKLLDEAKQQKAQNDSSVIAKKEILDSMRIYYLWYDKLNNVSTTDADDPQTFYYKILYRTLDKWSFILSKSEYQDFVTATYYGHGIGIALDENGDMRVSFVFKGTRAYNSGIKRGWKFVQVNGTKPLSVDHLADLLGSETAEVSNSILFEKPDKKTTLINITKEKITINPFLENKVLTVADKKVGYIALQSFMADSAVFFNNVNSIFGHFNAENISELVIDLRYNGGGSLDYTQILANLIIGNFYSGSKFVSLQLNNQFNNNDAGLSSRMEHESNSLNNKISRIFFITNHESASASEVIIACLKPYLNVMTIGSRTSGKPVGMFDLPLKKSNNILVPIIFTWVDANNKSISYNGIPVDKFVNDDLIHEMGDTNEACLKEALNYIETGAFGSSKKSFKEIPAINTSGYRAYRNAY